MWSQELLKHHVNLPSVLLLNAEATPSDLFSLDAGRKSVFVVDLDLVRSTWGTWINTFCDVVWIWYREKGNHFLVKQSSGNVFTYWIWFWEFGEPANGISSLFFFPDFFFQSIDFFLPMLHTNTEFVCNFVDFQNLELKSHFKMCCGVSECWNL